MGMMKYNVIMIVVDAVRARNIHCYGYEKETTPSIDAIARQGVIFKNAFSTTNVTDPSITTILTGKIPFHHGIVNHGGRITIWERMLANHITPLSLILKRNEYATFALDILGRWHKKGVDHYMEASTLKSMLRRILRKLKIYDALPNKIKMTLNPRYNAEHVTNLALKIIRENKRKQFFLFIHYWDTHAPYNAPKGNWEKFLRKEVFVSSDDILSSIHNSEWRKFLQQVLQSNDVNTILAKYDCAINYIDAQIERIFEALEQNDLIDKTILVITSDHGESLLEHGIYFDHHGLYDVSLHVPLIILFPGCPRGKVVEELVQHQDLVPTILDILNIKYKEPDMGRSLVPIVDGEETGYEWLFFYETYTQNRIAYRDREFKLIIDPTGKYEKCRYCGRTHSTTVELYNVAKDPHETENLSSIESEIVKELSEKLMNYYKLLRKNYEMKKSIMKVKKALMNH